MALLRSSGFSDVSVMLGLRTEAVEINAALESGLRSERETVGWTDSLPFLEESRRVEEEDRDLRRLCRDLDELRLRRCRRSLRRLREWDRRCRCDRCRELDTRALSEESAEEESL